MEQSLADILGDAFSDTSVPTFHEEDLDFEHFDYDEKFEEDITGISEDALHQEATSDMYLAEHVDKEQSDKNDDEAFQSVGAISMDETLEEDYTSSEVDSEQEGSDSGDDEDEEDEERGTGENPGDLLMSVRCSDEFCDGNKEDGIFAEGQPLGPEGAEKPQVRNEEQGESESDEEVSYFKRVPGRGSEMMIKGDSIEEDGQEGEEEKREDSFDSECGGMKVERGENVLAMHFEQEVVNPCSEGQLKISLEFPEISVEKLQDLIAEVDREEYSEKVREFSGEEHQEAGESFADYPSDFSSCEYVEDGGKDQESDRPSNASACTSDNSSMKKQDASLDRAVADTAGTGRAADSDEEGDEYLYSKDLKVDADRFRSLDVATGERDRGKIETNENVIGDAAVSGSDDEGKISDSDSYISSDDEVQVKRSDEELDIGLCVDSICQQDRQNKKQLEEIPGGSGAGFTRQSASEDRNRADPTDLHIDWKPDVLPTDTLLSEDLLTTEDRDEEETLLSDLTPSEDVNSNLSVQSGDAKYTNTSPSNQGSLDDSFFFTAEPGSSGAGELGQLGDDEYEEDRNWQQEQERIKAFYEFYDDSDGENDREGRQIRVQFSSDPLSEVIHYETDSSERDSLSSSTDGEEDLSSADISEASAQELREPDDTTQIEPACGLPNTQLPERETEFKNKLICTRKHKCLNLLKMTLKMCVVIAMGLLMFWLATDQAGWFSPLM